MPHNTFEEPLSHWMHHQPLQPVGNYSDKQEYTVYGPHTNTVAEKVLGVEDYRSSEVFMAILSFQIHVGVFVESLGTRASEEIAEDEFAVHARICVTRARMYMGGSEYTRTLTCHRAQ